MNAVLEQKHLSLKNKCVEFMFSYQQKNVDKMLSVCDPEGTINFVPLGEAGKGRIHDLGKAIWTGLIEAFPNIDNTVDAAIAEDSDTIRCQVVMCGTQKRDFADIKSRNKHFESDHIFIFHLNGANYIDHIEVSWDHQDLKRQLGSEF